MGGMIQNEFYRVRVVDHAVPAFWDAEADYPGHPFQTAAEVERDMEQPSPVD